MTRFRPCIDLHDGKVKQIVGGTLKDGDDASAKGELRTNFISDRPPAHFADLYRQDHLTGGHVIMLGPGNEAAAREALAAYPGGFHIGGGIRAENAAAWLGAGASHVIVTSWLFDKEGHFQEDRLQALAGAVGADRLVLDLSCRREPGSATWVVAMNRWQTPTDLRVTPETLDALASSCAEFLVHAADVEGKCEGIDEALVRLLGDWGKKPITYAGGAYALEDLERVHALSQGRVDLTIGSALDIFGGRLVKYADCVEFNRRQDANA